MNMMKIADYGERLFLLVISAFFVRAMLSQASLHPYLILLTVSECLPVLLIIIRRPGAMVMKPYPYFLAFGGTVAPLLVRPSTGGLQLIPDVVAAAIIGLGLAFNIFAKIALWRSFGLAPANRGIRAGGPYRLIRHPMYLGYFLTQVAFLLANLTIGNLAKYLVTWTLQLLRIREEEKFLMLDQSYRDLATRVRFRLVPGLY
jgi:protein-S-isoprenylcysteine O-methyltransferase Ste14